ncbi:nuclear transport factor 2 family protein [Streptomyces sp. NPDC047821]|uniref:nuclear transport factor 2 family protein n=1 Tax=Streptomyces sp. NPDC047821 TaxID=3365488 RepID=UPI0037142670
MPPERPGDPGDELADVVANWAAAIVANDAARIGAYMADDWVIVSASGVATRDHFLALVASGELTHSAMEPVGEPRVRIDGDTALFTGRITNTAHHRGERYDADEWTTDVFLRRDGNWRCVLTHVTPASPD